MGLVLRNVLSAGLAFIAACAGPATQAWPRVEESSAVAADRCRVYLARDDDARSAMRHVRIVDDGATVGSIGNDEYLCWDRPAARGVGQAFFDGLDPAYGNVENVFDLPREGGATTWLVVRVGQLRKPEIARLSADEGRALIARRIPAAPK